MTRRILLSFIAFPVSFAIALASISARNFVAHRHAIFVASASAGNITCMRISYLLGVDVNAPDCQYNTCLPPIVAAGMRGHDDAILFLLDRGADINGTMPHGQTALMEAAYFGHTATVKLLLLKGADVNADSEYGTALSWAKAGGQVEIVEILRQAGAR